MLFDIEGIVRLVRGFSKVPNSEGTYTIQVEYELKNLSLHKLRNIFDVDPNDPDITVRHMIDRYHILNESQAAALQPYVLYGQIDLNQYDFSLDSCQADDWDWSAGYPPIQVKNVIASSEIESITRKRDKLLYPPLVVAKEGQKSLALLLDSDYWEKFYYFIQNNYIFSEFSAYQINWENVHHYKRLNWLDAKVSPMNIKLFLQNTCVSKFKEIAIAYGPKEPIILISSQYFSTRFLRSFFKDGWGTCFIIGAKRNKYGIVELVNECFLEVVCGYYLTTTH